MKYFLGVDNGGTGTKAAVYDQRGVELAVAGEAARVLVPRAGWAERDMEEMWASDCRVIQRVLAKAGLAPGEIACVACCGHGKGLYLWGRDGRPACPGICSTDNRAWAYPLAWSRDGTGERVFRRSRQSILAGQPVSLLAWLRDHRPEVLEESRWLFSCKDYIRFRLTGNALAERTDASGSNLLNLETGAYDPELLALFGLERYQYLLPPLRDSGALCGSVTEEAARQTGLSPGTPVAAGAFDIDACALAVGSVDEDTVCMVAGTWSINEYVSPSPVVDGSVLMNSLFCLPGRYLIEECSPTSAGNLEWFITNLLPELKRECQGRGEGLYDRLNRWVESLRPEEPCPLFLPFLMGSNVHPRAKGCLIGLDASHTRAHLVRAVYEGVTFSHRHHLDRLLKTRARPPKTIRLAGGVRHAPVWVQMFADVMGLPVEVTEGEETGTLGCAMVGAAAIGTYDSLTAAAGHMCRVSARVLPREEHRQAYERKYALYRRAADLLDPIWNEPQTDGSGEELSCWKK